MKKIFLTIMAVVICAITANAQVCVYPTDTVKIKFKIKPQGVLEGDFTINSSGGKVRFAQGNLQYTRASTDVDWSTGSFSFMSNQYDYVETPANPYCEADYADKTAVGLFAWATSGWDNTSKDASSVHYQPWSTSSAAVASSHPDYNTNRHQYGPSLEYVGNGESWSKEVAGNHPYENYDWGVYNSSDLGSGWRTLTREEWNYILADRTNASNLHTTATVNDVPGHILMPDGWTEDGVHLEITTSTAGASSGYILNDINLTNWNTLEEQGCVFLPACGIGSGTEVGWWGQLGYQTSTAREAPITPDNIYANNYSVSATSADNISNRWIRRPVRLVIDVE